MSRNLRNILLPVGAMYGGIVAVRNYCYDGGFFRVKRLPRPVISVGNISVGGTGKTPFVMLLLAKLLAMGKKPAVLSRGYKRFTDDLIISCPGSGSEADIRMLGDEPALISANFPGVPVAVHADRQRGGFAVLEKYEADVFVLDDGFQNRELGRDLDFVLMNRSMYDLRDSYLPAGDLRDSKNRLRQADVIVLTSHELSKPDPAYRELLGKYSGAPVAGVSYVAEDLYDHTGTHHPVDRLRKGKVIAFCGIARSEQFFRNVSELSGNYVSERHFSDHHWYDEYDIDEIFQGDEDAIAVTTPKDAIRIFDDEELRHLEDIDRIYALSERTVVDFGEEHIVEALNGVFGNADV